MKRIILILLFTPLISFGQVKYKDLMKIDSKDKFLKYMFDLRFSNIENDSNSYAFEPFIEDGKTLSTHFAFWREDIGFMFQIIRKKKRINLLGEIVSDNDYDRIENKIKKKCEFKRVFETSSSNYFCYECKDALFDGYIGLGVNNESGYLVYFPYDYID